MDTELNAKSGATLAAPRLARAQAKGALAWLGALVLLIGLPAMGYAASQAHLQRLSHSAPGGVQIAENIESPNGQTGAGEQEDAPEPTGRDEDVHEVDYLA